MDPATQKAPGPGYPPSGVRTRPPKTDGIFIAMGLIVLAFMAGHALGATSKKQATITPHRSILRGPCAAINMACPKQPWLKGGDIYRCARPVINCWPVQPGAVAAALAKQAQATVADPAPAPAPAP